MLFCGRSLKKRYLYVNKKWRILLFFKIIAFFGYIAYLSSQSLHGTAESFIRESRLLHNEEEKRKSNQIEVCWFLVYYVLNALRIKSKF